VVESLAGIGVDAAGNVVVGVFAADLFCPGISQCPYLAKLSPDGETSFATSYILDMGAGPIQAQGESVYVCQIAP
jgi:hypothetical protein